MTDWMASPALPRGLSFEDRIYLSPAGMMAGEVASAAIAAGRALRLAGGPLAFAEKREPVWKAR